jgi:hypothetical protein
MVKYIVCMRDYSGQVMLYWNSLLGSWVGNRLNASPYTGEELPEWAKTGRPPMNAFVEREDGGPSTRDYEG